MKKLLKLSMLSLGVMASGATFAAGVCSVNYKTSNNWGTGGQEDIILTNTGSSVSSWELCWAFNGSEVVTNLWNGTYTANGKNICVKNAPYNASLGANASVSFGFTHNNAPGAIPTQFTLNGVACDGAVASSTPTTSSAAPSSVPTTSSAAPSSKPTTSSSVPSSTPTTSSAAPSSAAAAIVIQAENYAVMQGVQTEGTSDTGGGMNVGYIDAGDWLSYPEVDLPCGGSYTVEYRVASQSTGGQLQLEKAGGSPVFGSLSFTATGGWQNWKTVSHNVTLPAGKLALGIAIPQGGWNLNWIRLIPNCGVVSSSSVPSSTPTTSSAASSSAPANGARWLLDGTNSTFHFVSTKKIDVEENFTFTQLQGTVGADGKAVLTIPLASLSTGVDIRNTRMQSMLFESNYLPSLHFSTQLDLAAIDALPTGSISTLTVAGNLTLHGITKAITFDAMVVKHANNSVSLSPRKAIIIDSVDFDLNAGIEALRVIGSLTSITEKVPVYFKMYLSKDNPTNIPAIALPAAPNAPLSLAASVSNATGAASLTWADVSSGETGFLVRRKGADGRWATVTGTPANSVSYIDNLSTLGSGSYDYKLISYVDSIPSVATAPATVVYDNGIASVSSSSVSSASSSAAPNGQTLFTQQCASCHNINNTAFPADKNLATLTVYIRDKMPIQDPTLCGQECANAVAAYLLNRTTTSSSVVSVSSKTSSSVASVCAGDTCAPRYGERLLRVLNKNEYLNSVADLTGVNMETAFDSATLGLIPADTIVGGFTNNAHAVINDAVQLSYETLANKIADAAATNGFASVVNCSGLSVAACGDKFVTDFGKRAFRRPFTTEERTNYLAFFSSALGVTTNSDGIKLALRAALSSPQFLYRSELGVKMADLKAGTVDASAGITLNDISAADRALLPDTAYVLTPYEVASFLAFTYTGSTPDATLLAAADTKALQTKTQTDAQITRLLGTAKARQHYGKFATQWLNVDSLPVEPRNTTVYPTFTPQVRTAMLDEVRAIYNDVVLDGAPFTNLYTSPYTFVNATLANFYGLNAAGLGSTPTKVTAPGRGGLITSGAFLAQHAHFGKTAPILRAVRIRRALLCHDVGNPPNGVAIDKIRADQQAAFDALKAQQGGFATARQEYHFLTSVSPCTDCHQKIINPLGFGLENFNTVGLPQANDINNLPIAFQDDDGTLYGVKGLDDTTNLSFNGAKNLGEQLTATPDGLAQLRSCFVQNNFRLAFATGLNYYDRNQLGVDGKPLPLTADEMQNNAADVAVLIQEMANQNNSVKTMLQQLGNLKSVRYRKDYVQ